ncbi:MAG TPA: AraC family transcriptional regulator ligand-binding domain-containing protein [Kofleriaceae bacterium]
MRPFLQLLRGYPEIPTSALEELGKRADDERIPARKLLHLLDAAILVTGAHDLGLRAAAIVDGGDNDVLEFAARSCATLGEALEAVLRYMPLVNDAAAYTFAVHDRRARLELRSTILLNRAASDFQTCVLVRALRAALDDALPAHTEIWFRHAAPADARGYAQWLAGAEVRFAAPVDAILFDASELTRDLCSANPKLLDVLRRHAEHLLTELPQPESLPASVRKLVLDQLAEGNVTADHIAARLHMSRRTLTRRLAATQTSYQALLDDVRRRLGLELLKTTRLGIRDIAFRLGFSETAAFSRACKRWTGKSPADLRHAR